ncbi:MAG: right-handed parallel beta-helix repeat-containing protein [Candidatus Micrarchaeia archaeon]
MSKKDPDYKSDQNPASSGQNGLLDSSEKIPSGTLDLEDSASDSTEDRKEDILAPTSTDSNDDGSSNNAASPSDSSNPKDAEDVSSDNYETSQIPIDEGNSNSENSNDKVENNQSESKSSSDKGIAAEPLADTQSDKNSDQNPSASENSNSNSSEAPSTLDQEGEGGLELPEQGINEGEPNNEESLIEGSEYNSNLARAGPSDKLFGKPLSYAEAASQKIIDEINKKEEEKRVEQDKKAKRQKLIKTVVLPIAIVLLIVLLVLPMHTSTPSAASNYTTTIPNQNHVVVKKFSGCESINKPGIYTLSSNITTKVLNNACIKINSSNVKLNCNNHIILGSGPYLVIKPYSYGIYVTDASNVTITNCTAMNFSFGMFAFGSSNLHIENNNFSNNYINQIYLNNTKYSNIVKNHVGISSFSAIKIINGSIGNNFIGNRLFLNNIGFYVNSSNNVFKNNYATGYNTSFYCSLGNGFVMNNKAYNNTCFNESGCAFIQCKGFNTPPNLGNVALSSPIYGCGTIYKPGYYYIAGNINASDYLTMQQFAMSYTPCILIDAANVKINGGGFTISNAFDAIGSTARTNITIENINVANSIYGINYANVNGFNLYNDSFENNTFGLMLSGSNYGNVYKSIFKNNNYSVYLAGSQENSFNNISVINSEYGIYLNYSKGNSFYKDYIMNNSAFDVFANLYSAQSGTNLMHNTVCNFSDAYWSTCKYLISPNLTYFPVTSCINIDRPGNYTVLNNLYSTQYYCIKINSNNVVLNCAYRSIASQMVNNGTAIIINGRNNVTVKNCNFTADYSAFKVSNSANINLINNVGSLKAYGISAYNMYDSSIINNTISGAQNNAFVFSNSYKNKILKNYALYDNYGFNITGNSSNNIIENNTGYRLNYGMVFGNNTFNNTVFNNSISLSLNPYVCIGTSSSINSEFGGINYGTSKSNCRWMAVLPQSVNWNPSCVSTSQPDYLPFSQDYIYIYGSSCFNLNGGNSVINCEGHTIYSTNGGTFATFTSGKNNEIENCNLKGFATAVKAFNTTVTLLNDTIYGEGSAVQAPSVMLQNSNYSSILSTTVYNSYIGIKVMNSHFLNIKNNMVEHTNESYAFYNVTNSNIYNNNASYDITGMLLYNSTQNNFQYNNLQGITGLVCAGSSFATNSNNDKGSNVCTGSSNCYWLSSSASSCK